MCRLLQIMENVCKEEDEGDNENKLKAILFYQFEDIPKQVSEVSASFLFLSLFFPSSLGLGLTTFYILGVC